MTSEPRAGHSLRGFVRSAWVLLVFQLLAAAAAVLVTAWATLQVRPLLAQRDQLTQDIREAKVRISELGEIEKKTRASIDALEKEKQALRTDLEGARKATPVLTEAINAFHRRNYAAAIIKYDEALRLNPGDPYIYNLKSYSQFKAGDMAGAARTLSRGLSLDPTYDWGYFDLARYQCAAGAPQEALQTITQAVERRGAPVRRALTFFLTEDGEFARLCAPIRQQLRQLADR